MMVMLMMTTLLVSLTRDWTLLSQLPLLMTSPYSCVVQLIQLSIIVGHLLLVT